MQVRMCTVDGRIMTDLGFTEWKFYFLYIIWDALIPIFIYFVFVETHGKTLEELTQIFRDANKLSK